MRGPASGLTLTLCGVAGAVTMATPAPARAESPVVTPAGALDLRLGGFMRFGLEFGSGEIEDLRDFRFITDTEFHVRAQGRHDASGLTYGAAIEFEADASASTNVDENSLYASGGWGDLVLGNNDSGTLEVGGLSRYADTVFDGYYGGVGAQTVSAGSGGIDGDLDTLNPAGYVYSTFDSGDATKIRYDSPVLGSPSSGFVLSAAFTPDTGNSGDNSTSLEDDGDFETVVELGALYGFGWTGGHVIAGGTAAFGSAEDLTDPDTGLTTDGDGEFFDYGLGAEVFLGSFGLSGAWGQNESEEADWFSLGAGYRGSVFNASVNYGWTDNDAQDVQPEQLIVSFDTGLMQGVVLQGDVGWVDPDTENTFFTGLLRVQVSF